MPLNLRPIEDKYPTFNFLVEIDGVQAAGFTEISGMEKETEVIEYREGADGTSMRKFRGLTKYAPLVLKRGQSSDLDLWNKANLTFDAFTGATGNNSPLYRFDFYLIQQDSNGNEVLRWKFIKGWVSKYMISDFDAATSEASFEEITIEHEGFYLENPS